jgi:hypothetical protein
MAQKKGAVIDTRKHPCLKRRTLHRYLRRGFRLPALSKANDYLRANQSLQRSTGRWYQPNSRH